MGFAITQFVFVFLINMVHFVNAQTNTILISIVNPIVSLLVQHVLDTLITV